MVKEATGEVLRAEREIEMAREELAATQASQEAMQAEIAMASAAR
jgi:hypothetical protein